MTIWTNDELNKIGTAEELIISSLRADDTLRKSVIIWVIRLGDDLYVRSVNGRTSPWFCGTQVRHKGHIQAGGVDKDVAFLEETDPGINKLIDATYRTKYQRYPSSVDHINSPTAQTATIKLVPL